MNFADKFQLPMDLLMEAASLYNLSQKFLYDKGDERHHDLEGKTTLGSDADDFNRMITKKRRAVVMNEHPKFVNDGKPLPGR